MYMHNTHYYPEPQWFDNHPNQNELDDMYFYCISEKKMNPRQRYHSPQHFYNPEEDYFFDDEEEEYQRRRSSFHGDCYCEHCGRRDVRPKSKKNKLKRRQTIGNFADAAVRNENAWNLRQKSVYTPNNHGPVRDPMTPMPTILGPPCTTGAQDNSGWFPMMNAMPPPTMPNTNSFMMPNNPMMQPYFLPMPIPDFSTMTYPFSQHQQQQQQQQQGYRFPDLRPNSAPEALPNVTPEETVADKPKVVNDSNAPLSHDVNKLVKATDPTTQEKHAKGHPETMTFPLKKTLAPVQRRKSLVDELISTVFGPSVKKEPIYNTKWDPSSFTSLSDFVSNGDTGQSSSSKSAVSSPQQASSSSTSPAAPLNLTTALSPTNPTPGLSRKVSLKLSQKANILSKRPFVWCYRPFQGNDGENIWAAFDVNNQTKLDVHFQSMLMKKQQQIGGDDTITKDATITLQKQSKLPGKTIVASYHGMAWHYENGSTECKLLEIGRIQTDNNNFVVSNDLVEDQRLRRSKSLDKLASKLFSTVLGK